MNRTRIFQFWVSMLACLAIGSANADYKQTVKDNLWGNLYKDGGKTFYCDKGFDKQTPLLAVSHIYGEVQVRDYLQCGTKRRCMRNDAKYQEIMSDLHNMVVADSYFEFKRKGAKFGPLDQSIEANECGLRVQMGFIEPPARIKGDIARVLFYLYERYGLPLPTHVSVLHRWHQDDPPSEEEIARNLQISSIQGNENSFINNPTLAFNID